MRDVAWQRAAAGAVAGLAAGVLLSGAWLAMEAASGETAEVVRLGRRSLAKAGQPAKREGARPDTEEQTMSNGGHWAGQATPGR